MRVKAEPKKKIAGVPKKANKSRHSGPSSSKKPSSPRAAPHYNMRSKVKRKPSSRMTGNYHYLYSVRAQDAINIRMISKPSDVSTTNTSYFKPTMTHQIFGDTELVFGYRNLLIDLYYSTSTAIAFLDLKYTEVFKPEDESDPLPDNIYEKLKPWLPSNFCTNQSEFISLLKKEKKSKGYGKQIAKFESTDRNGDNHNFVVAHCSLDNEAFCEFHKRLQTLIVFFIDAASYISLTDKRWMVFYIFETNRNKNSFVPVGFCTVYRFYSYPDRTRPRISQCIILPNYQRMGLGSKLLKNVYQYIWNMENIHEITVERPSAAFTRMRDIVDSELLLSHPLFKRQKVVNGYTRSMTIAATEEFKFNTKQISKVYKILLYYHTVGTRVEKRFEKYIKDKIVIWYKGKYRLAKRANNAEKMEFFEHIIHGDIMSNKLIENKYRQFIRQIQPVVDSLKNARES